MRLASFLPTCVQACPPALPCLAVLDTARARTEQLKPQDFEAACFKKGQTLTVRMHEGYDHSYFFISSVIDDHVDFHADALGL